jgi:hypothetical protein
MSTSLEEREASCAYKGHNSPFDSTIVYSVGSSVTQKHFGQSSLILLHIKIYTFIRFLDSNLVKPLNLSQFYIHEMNLMRHHLKLLLLLLKYIEKKQESDEVSSNTKMNTLNSKINSHINSAEIKNEIQILKPTLQSQNTGAKEKHVFLTIMVRN